MQGCFITGTDTDAGKTLVTSGLLRGLLMQGMDSIAVKPIQTGCSFINGSLVPPDVQCYSDAVKGLEANDNPHACIYSFEPACSPHKAASAAGVELDLELITRNVRDISNSGRYPLVEGAGGVFVPLGKGKTMLDLMKRLGLPVILVASNKLGMINHTLLSIRALRDEGLDVLCVVVNNTTPPQDSEEADLRADNLRAVREYGSVLVGAEIPFLESHSDGTFSWDSLDIALSPVVSQLLGLSARCKTDKSHRLQFDREHIWHPYTSATDPLPVYDAANASGCEVTLSDGRKLVDGMSSWWCAIHGYNHPALNEAARGQLAKMSHFMFGGMTHEPAVALAERLIEITPNSLQHVFFADSGSVSVEVAMKMALQYWQTKGELTRTRFVTVRGGYHGDTTGAMSVCDPVGGMHHLFTDMLPKQIFAERPSCRFDEPFTAESLEDIVSKIRQHENEIAAVILEPIVQGAGGMWFYHPEYLRALRSICDAHGILLILDEIATGFGRTGKLFACEWAGIEPDIMCIGKALTGGYMTMAATLASTEVAHGISSDGGVLMHGPTFMANPLACAVANANLEILRTREWESQVKAVHGWLNDGLQPCRELNGVTDIRVLGAIGIVQVDQCVNIARLQRFFVENGVWIRPFRNLIYVMPPYAISHEQIERLTNSIHKAVCHGEYV